MEVTNKCIIREKLMRVLERQVTVHIRNIPIPEKNDFEKYIVKVIKKSSTGKISPKKIWSFSQKMASLVEKMKQNGYEERYYKNRRDNCIVYEFVKK